MSRLLEASPIPDPFTQADLTDYVQNLKPQADLINPDKYDNNTITYEGLKVADSKIGVNSVVPGWRYYQIDYTDFPTASTTSADHTIISLGAGTVIENVKVIVKTGFDDGTGPISNVVLNVGTTPSTPTEYINGVSIQTATTTTAAGTYSGNSFLTENASTNIICNITCTGGNCSALTAGQAWIFIKYGIADGQL